MKTPDLSKTPFVQKYGVRGARWHGRICFAALYAMLTAITAALWIFSPEFEGTWRRAILGILIAILVVIAASVLTRMRLEFFAGVEQLEASERTV